MRKLLLPFSFIYSGITSMRNLMYDRGWKRSVRFSVPVICVGNITVGGTGKTPCIEYLIRLVSESHKPSLISRGYRRKTKGLLMATSLSDADEIGDEPFQMKRRFPNLPIVVSADRVLGINHLIRNSDTDVVLMDDGFQHRSVKAGLYVLMTDYHRPMWNDYTFPAGMLREPASGRRRAAIIIVNKCPNHLSQEEQESIRKRLIVNGEQNLFFTRIKYGNFKSFSSESGMGDVAYDTIIAVSGIGNPHPFHAYLKQKARTIVEMPFGDHHHFTQEDLDGVEHQFVAAQCVNKCVVITEKDAARLHGVDLSGYGFASHLLFLPIELEFLNGKNKFDQLIEQYVGKNQ